MSRQSNGLCALTGARGKFVRAHIIPAALTRPRERGIPYIQGGEGTRPLRRWTSWYDPNLVTAEGEEILAEYDERGIAILRDHQLIWSSFKADRLESGDHTAFPNGTHGIRVIEGLDGKRLRLFLLSVLWRAAATTQPEFEAVKISKEKLGRLQQMLVSREPDPLYLFPCSIMQISTKGPWHNHTPIAGVKRVSRGERKPQKIRIFRFFFDGLAVHFHRDVNAEAQAGMGGLSVGTMDKLGVPTVTYEASFQKQNLELSIAETELGWPNDMRKLKG